MPGGSGLAKHNLLFGLEQLDEEVEDEAATSDYFPEMDANLAMLLLQQREPVY